MSGLSSPDITHAQNKWSSQAAGQRALDRSLDCTAPLAKLPFCRPVLLHLYAVTLSRSVLSTQAAASHAAARPACAAGPADRVPVPLRTSSMHALLFCDGMLISQCSMIALHQEGCTAC